MPNFEEYQGKRVVVTGCASGIGRATATTLTDLGARVVGVDRNEPDFELDSFQSLDLADPSSISAAAAAIGGSVDALFNCAGSTPMMPSMHIVKVNFLGTRLFTERMSELMGDGTAIVSVSSDASLLWRRNLQLLLEFLAVPTFDGGAAWYEEHETAAGHGYSFGKEAVSVWTMQQSSTLIKRGIRINCTSPGAVQTPMLDAIEAAYTVGAIEPTHQQIGRRSTAQEQVGPLLFLNSSLASYVNGADVAVDGGFSAATSVAG